MLRTLLVCIALAIVFGLTACTRSLPPVSENYAEEDPQIREAVLEQFREIPITTLSRVNVEVERGVVKLTGLVVDHAEIIKMTRAAEQVEGVRAVRNQVQVPSRGRGARAPSARLSR